MSYTGEKESHKMMYLEELLAEKSRGEKEKLILPEIRELEPSEVYLSS